MTSPARRELLEEFPDLTAADRERLLCELWDGYQELLAEERKSEKCDSKDSG
jgi:hypothetical protein